MIDPYLIRFALYIRTIDILIRVCGGTLHTPLLSMVVGVRQTMTVGTDLTFAGGTKIVSAYSTHAMAHCQVDSCKSTPLVGRKGNA
jgi:uncharacterized membrane protein YfcA